MTALSRPATARFVAGRFRSHYASKGWRVFLSDRGRWWATTSTREAVDYKRGMTLALVPDAVDADDASGLASELDRRTR